MLHFYNNYITSGLRTCFFCQKLVFNAFALSKNPLMLQIFYLALLFLLLHPNNFCNQYGCQLLRNRNWLRDITTLNRKLKTLNSK